ncbi:unnamed protein product [Nesidiocoris tenuis]|uniref:Uncharacterized protein n=1 Tax=Nesidiocoris tenuis TaxID=355587 RepID=A0A6H5HPA2_9HEMI|nr:unnamed protein product [Nesidiocoris tenuis]
MRSRWVIKERFNIARLFLLRSAIRDYQGVTSLAAEQMDFKNLGCARGATPTVTRPLFRKISPADISKDIAPEGVPKFQIVTLVATPGLVVHLPAYFFQNLGTERRREEMGKTAICHSPGRHSPACSGWSLVACATGYAGYTGIHGFDYLLWGYTDRCELPGRTASLGLFLVSSLSILRPVRQIVRVERLSMENLKVTWPPHADRAMKVLSGNWLRYRFFYDDSNTHQAFRRSDLNGIKSWVGSDYYLWEIYLYSGQHCFKKGIWSHSFYESFYYDNGSVVAGELPRKPVYLMPTLTLHRAKPVLTIHV